MLSHTYTATCDRDGCTATITCRETPEGITESGWLLYRADPDSLGPGGCWGALCPDHQDVTLGNAKAQVKP